jgi:hypothetical protein
MPFFEGMAPVKLGSQYGYIDNAGQWLIEPSFQLALPFTGSAAVIISNNRWGLISQQGRVLIPPRLPWREGEIPVHYYEGRTAIKVNERYGFLDEEGKWAASPVFEWVGDFSEGLAAVKENGRYGYLNRAGEIVIPCTLEGAGLFVGGLAPARHNGQWGYINTNGDWQIPPTFLSADTFSNKLARISLPNNRWAYINATGQSVWEERD